MNPQEKELYNLVKAGVKLIQIVSYETLRFHGMLIHVSEEMNRDLYVWNRTEGIKKWNSDNRAFEEADSSFETPDSAIEFHSEHDNMMLLLEDFYPDLTEDKPRMIRTFRNIAMQNDGNKTLVFSQPFLQLPKELEKDVHIFELPYPDFEDLKAIYKNTNLVRLTLDDREVKKFENFTLALNYAKTKDARNLKIEFLQNYTLTSEDISTLMNFDKNNVSFVIKGVNKDKELRINDSIKLSGNTKFEDIVLDYGTNTSNGIYARGHRLEMGQNITMKSTGGPILIGGDNGVDVSKSFAVKNIIYLRKWCSFRPKKSKA